MSGSITKQNVRELSKIITKAKAKLIKRHGTYVEKYWKVDRYKTCDECKLSKLDRTMTEMYKELEESGVI